MARLPAQRGTPPGGGSDLGQRMETVRQALLLTVSGYSPALVELFTDDVVGVSPLMSVGNRDELGDVLRQRDELLTEVDLQLEATDMADHRLLAEWVMNALPVVALAPTPPEATRNEGRVSLRGVTIARFMGSQIQEFRHYWDRMERLDG